MGWGWVLVFFLFLDTFYSARFSVPCLSDVHLKNFVFALLYTPFLWYRGFYDTAVFILSVPMHCSATRRFFYLYIHKHNSHIYRNVWSFCPNVLNFCKYTYFYLFLRNSGHFYFTLIPCFVKCPIIKP